jgi:hypothetical protein
MKRMENAAADILKDKTLTNEIYIEGIGKVREYGELDLERLVKRLLKCKGITG